jgi:hypothetical protein
VVECEEEEKEKEKEIGGEGVFIFFPVAEGQERTGVGDEFRQKGKEVEGEKPKWRSVRKKRKKKREKWGEEGVFMLFPVAEGQEGTGVGDEI